MHDRQPIPTDSDLDTLNDSELRALVSRCQAKLGRRATAVASTIATEPNGFAGRVREKWDRFRSERQERARENYRARQKEAAPHLGFADPEDLDRYTVTDLKIIDAFYAKAAMDEPSKRVYLPRDVDPDA